VMKLAGIAFCLFLVGTSPLFAADTPQFELAGSYVFMQDTSRSDSFPGGWAVAATGNVNSWIGVVAEVGGSHKSCDNCQRGPFATERFRGTNLHISVLTFMAGARGAPPWNSIPHPLSRG